MTDLKLVHFVQRYVALSSSHQPCTDLTSPIGAPRGTFDVLDKPAYVEAIPEGFIDLSGESCIVFRTSCGEPDCEARVSLS